MKREEINTEVVRAMSSSKLSDLYSIRQGEAESKFDTWLAEVKRESQEQAWEEAIAAQQEVDLEWESYIMSNDNRMKPPKIAGNPYRAT